MADIDIDYQAACLALNPGVYLRSEELSSVRPGLSYWVAFPSKDNNPHGGAVNHRSYPTEAKAWEEALPHLQARMWQQALDL